MLRGLRRFHDIGFGFMLHTKGPPDTIVENKCAGHGQGLIAADNGLPQRIEALLFVVSFRNHFDSRGTFN